MTLGGALACVALFPSLAQAQSAIAGTVKDTSGAVIPGVTVEASSPVLIEKERSVVTDQAGQYKIVALRPGTYTVTFSLPGFSSVRRDGIDLPADFTLSLNAEMRVGAVEETITVSGGSPVVDVQNTSKSQVINQSALETLPTGRTLHAIGELVVGITMSRPDVGGSAGMQQTYMSLHGLAQTQNTIEVDGINSAQVQLDGVNTYYFPQAYVQEMVYQTSSIGADATGGGVRANVVPKDGGNTFSGTAFAAGFPGSWVATNLTQALRDRGLGAPNKVDRSFDYEASLGGPIRHDKVWFYADVRYYSVNSFIADTYVCEGCYGKATAPRTGPQGLDSQWVLPIYGRVTWQASPRNKLAGYYNWNFKDRDGQMTPGTDPITARQDFTYQGHVAYVAAAKWTSTITNKLLLELGFSPNYLTWTNDAVPHSKIQPRGSPAWYATPQKTDLDLGTTWSNAQSISNNPVRNFTKGSLSYITGSHSIKVGGVYDFGHFRTGGDTNADLIQQYRLGVPTSVSALNTPRVYNNIYTLGALFAQDSWTLKRLTLSPGLRFEHLNQGYAAQTDQAGRFVGVRTFPRVDDLPTWNTWSPRFGAAYDLFGNAKTALKFALNRYDFQRLTGFVTNYNPLAGSNVAATLSWTDLNQDDIAQGELGCQYLTPGCEINMAQLPANFGVRSLNTLDPDIKRPYYIETSVSLQHELLPRVSVSGGWLKSDAKNIVYSYNTLTTFNDYTPVSVVSPLDGQVFTAYNLNRNKLGAVANFDSNDLGAKQLYTSYEFNVQARLPGGGVLFGGTSTERTVQVNCSRLDNPNSLLFCDQRNYDIPWRTQIKLNATYPLPWAGLNVAGVLQSYAPALLPAVAGGAGFAGTAGGANWLITPATRYAANCVGPCTPNALVIPNMTASSLNLPLTPGSTQLLERQNQLDLGVSKAFQMGRKRIQARFDVFNSLNLSPVLTVRSSNFGTAAYRQPSGILDGRTFRAGIQMQF